jgi:hypothetical protein
MLIDSHSSVCNLHPTDITIFILKHKYLVNAFAFQTQKNQNKNFLNKDPTNIMQKSIRKLQTMKNLMTQICN